MTCELVAIDDVMGVEIGLELVEAVEVVFARFAVPCPGGLLHRREHRAGSVTARSLVAPDIPIPERRLGIGARRLEPGVLVGRVVGDKVDDDAHAERLGVVHQLDKVSGGAEARAHAVEVADIVAVVAVGRAVEWLQPDAGDAETVQVIEPPAQSLEVSDAVAVEVHVGGDVQAVDNGVLEPVVVYGHRDNLRRLCYAG